MLKLHGPCLLAAAFLPFSAKSLSNLMPKLDVNVAEEPIDTRQFRDITEREVVIIFGAALPRPSF